ncbi:MAG: hypothetical protein ACOYOV_14485 [Bacteroidales bacterium]
MPKMLPITADTYNRIFKWVMDDNTSFISEKDKEIFDRWDYCDNQLRRFSHSRDVEKMMQQKFPNISMTQIRRDIENTKRFFSSVAAVNKKYEAAFLIEDIKDTLIKAKNTNNLMARIKAQQNYYMVLGIGKEDDIDLSLLEKHDYFAVIATESAAAKVDLLDMQQYSVTNRKNLSDLLESEITDVDAYKILNPELPDYDSEETISE